MIGIDPDDLRIWNDHGRPFLYPARLFEVSDPCEPAGWVTEFGDEGERYAYPPPLDACGFFEDFFDDEEEGVATLWRIVNQRLATAMAAV
jgi:hypothetical protein